MGHMGRRNFRNATAHIVYRLQINDYQSTFSYVLSQLRNAKRRLFRFEGLEAPISFAILTMFVPIESLGLLKYWAVILFIGAQSAFRLFGMRLEAEIQADYHAILAFATLKDFPYPASVFADSTPLLEMSRPINDTFMNDVDNEIRNETRMQMLHDAAHDRLCACNCYLWKGPLQMQCMMLVTRVVACVVVSLVIGGVQLVWSPWVIAAYCSLAAAGLIWSVHSSNFSLRLLNDRIVRCRPTNSTVTSSHADNCFK